MPAYWVARSKINDPVEYKKYTDLVPAIIAKYGGKVLARGGRFQIMEGPDKFHRFVVIEFPTFEQGVACFKSKEYDEAAAFRRGGAGEVETIMVEAATRRSDDRVCPVQNLAHRRQSCLVRPPARGAENRLRCRKISLWEDVDASSMKLNLLAFAAAAPSRWRAVATPAHRPERTSRSRSASAWR